MEQHMIKHFNKLIETNPKIQYAISTLVAEYDIASAHTTACYFIFGNDTYEKLMRQDKLSRNTQIGKMMAKDPLLHDQIASLLLRWFNIFCEENNIKDTNFITSTRDSILLVDKKPIKTSFENGLVNFRNKDGEFTSYIRLQKQRKMEVLFDNMSGGLRIKGIDINEIENYPFLKIFKTLLSVLEQSRTLPPGESLKKLNRIRSSYINSPNLDMYRSLIDKGKFIHYINGDRIESDTVIDPNALVKTDNYVNFVMPVVNIFFSPK
jgi:hypothetical protein